MKEDEIGGAKTTQEKINSQFYAGVLQRREHINSFNLICSEDLFRRSK
jgi:hypothetical protein